MYVRHWTMIPAAPEPLGMVRMLIHKFQSVAADAQKTILKEEYLMKEKLSKISAKIENGRVGGIIINDSVGDRATIRRELRFPLELEDAKEEWIVFIVNQYLLLNAYGYEGCQDSEIPIVTVYRMGDFGVLRLEVPVLTEPDRVLLELILMVYMNFPNEEISKEAAKEVRNRLKRCIDNKQDRWVSLWFGDKVILYFRGMKGMESVYKALGDDSSGS